MAPDISIQKSVELAVRRPAQSHILLAKTLAKVMNDVTWLNTTMKKKFCIFFMSNLIDQGIERDVDTSLLEKIKSRPLPQGLRMLKRTPEDGLKVLVVLVAQELKNQQKLSFSEQIQFFEEIICSFFPERMLMQSNEKVVHFSLAGQKEYTPGPT